MVNAADLIKNSIAIQPKRIKLITLNEEFLLKFGALKLYGDFFCEWLYARAMNIKKYDWRWGKFHVLVGVYDEQGKELPIMEFYEFNSWLQLAYYRAEYDI